MKQDTYHNFICYFWKFINIEYLQNSIYHIFNTNSKSLFNVYLVVNSILVVNLLRLSEGEIKPLLTYLLIMSILSNSE